jgi:hypothetical protein
MARSKNAAARRARLARAETPATKRAAKPAPAPARRAKGGPAAKAKVKAKAKSNAKPSTTIPAPQRRPPAAAAPVAGSAAVAERAANELRYLQSRRIEDLAQAFVSLTSELWIVKDRMAVLEQVLDRHGIPAPRAIDAFAPEGEFKAQLDAERRAWAQRMIAALFPRGLPKAD